MQSQKWVSIPFTRSNLQQAIDLRPVCARNYSSSMSVGIKVSIAIPRILHLLADTEFETVGMRTTQDLLRFSFRRSSASMSFSSAFC